MLEESWSTGCRNSNLKGRNKRPDDVVLFCGAGGPFKPQGLSSQVRRGRVPQTFAYFANVWEMRTSSHSWLAMRDPGIASAGNQPPVTAP